MSLVVPSSMGFIVHVLMWFWCCLCCSLKNRKYPSLYVMCNQFKMLHNNSITMMCVMLLFWDDMSDFQLLIGNTHQFTTSGGRWSFNLEGKRIKTDKTRKVEYFPGSWCSRWSWNGVSSFWQLCLTLQPEMLVSSTTVVLIGLGFHSSTSSHLPTLKTFTPNFLDWKPSWIN